MTEMINNKILHNKKRNVGLLYEFFSRYISKALIENRQTDVEKAKKLIRKHFNQSTDLYKEYKLFKTLKETTVSSRDAAVHLINRAREVASNQSEKRLDLEKTSLIHEINQVLDDSTFFNQNITNYKLYGTIQILLNSWRNQGLNENFETIIHFEEMLIKHLISQKASISIQEIKETDNVNRLVVDIMADKINKKFENLNEQQKKIITLYVLQEDDVAAKNELTLILSDLRKRINTFVLENKNDINIKNKLDEINNLLNNDYKDISNLNDELITFYLGISKLEKEFANG